MAEVVSFEAAPDAAPSPSEEGTVVRGLLLRLDVVLTFFTCEFCSDPRDSLRRWLDDELLGDIGLASESRTLSCEDALSGGLEAS